MYMNKIVVKVYCQRRLSMLVSMLVSTCWTKSTRGIWHWKHRLFECVSPMAGILAEEV